MPQTPDRPPTRAVACAAEDLRDLSSEWLDEMMKRVFSELDRQIRALSIESDYKREGLRDRAARTLASLERTLERLARVERERTALKDGKTILKDEDARKLLERRLDQLLAAGSAEKIPDEPQS